MVHSLKDTRSQRVSDPPGSDPERSDAAEEKRLTARRKFLLGGASALPVIVTLGRARQARAFSAGVCASLLAQGVDLDFTDDVASFICELE